MKNGAAAVECFELIIPLDEENPSKFPPNETMGISCEFEGNPHVSSLSIRFRNMFGLLKNVASQLKLVAKKYDKK